MNTTREEMWIRLSRALLAEIDAIENECIELSRIHSDLKSITREAPPVLAKAFEENLRKLKTYREAVSDYKKAIFKQAGRIERSVQAAN